LCQTYHRLGNHFKCTRWYSKVMWVMWNLVLVHLVAALVSVCFETVLVLVQDKCTVCAKYTIGLEIILDAPDGTPR
jgi:hypothetical protein